MNRNYSNVEKKYGHSWVSSLWNITLECEYGEPMHNKSGIIANWENVWTNNYVLLYKTYFCLKTRLHRKVWLHSVIFFTKFHLHSTAFQILFSQIIRMWELFFRSARS